MTLLVATGPVHFGTSQQLVFLSMFVSLVFGSCTVYCLDTGVGISPGGRLAGGSNLSTVFAMWR